MQPVLGRVLLVASITVPLLGCHGRSKDQGGLVNVRTRNGVHVRAPFVNVDVDPKSFEGLGDDDPASTALPPTVLAPP